MSESPRPASPAPLLLDDDRLFPTDPRVRTIARSLYEEIRGLPLLSPHGHIDAAVLADDTPFRDPASLFITPDHYVTRMLHAQGVPLEALGVPRFDGSPVETDPRAIWRLLCGSWHLFRGTASRLWLEQELVELFGVSVRPSLDTADEIYDGIDSLLGKPPFRPRALYETFGLEVLATTDSPLSSLDAHRRLRDDPTWAGRVIPTFRPDAFAEIGEAQWPQLIEQLAALTDADPTSYNGFLDALRERRLVFRAMGATATDHGPQSARSAPLSPSAAAGIFNRALSGTATVADADAFRANFLYECARMSCEDGLVMQLHPGVARNYDARLHETFGTDIGADIPAAVDYASALRPLLNAFGRHPNFTIVLFTIDESTFGRELAPLAGIYPSVRLGAPWWFLDAPGAMRRFRESTVEIAGLYNGAGFVDDTRAFCSIPARHDVARRVDCAFLADLVATGRLPLDEAAETAVDLTYTLAKQVFRL